MESVLIRFTADEFLHSTEPYDYLAGMGFSPARDHEVTAYMKFAKNECGISAKTFREELKKAELRAAGSNSRQVSAQQTEFPGQPAKLFCPGYLCNESGVWASNGMFGPVCICPQPIMPIRRIENYDTGERKIEVAFYDKNAWRTMIVPKSVLATANRIVQPLSERGVLVDSESAKSLVTYFTRMEAANILPETHSATRLGWISENKFLPYEKDLIFDGEVEFGQMYRAVTEFGDREKWFSLAREVRQSDNIVPRAMLAASFASALIKPLRKLPFFLHVWSDASGTGKTVGLMFAASVWADPNEEAAYVKNLNTTNVALEMCSSFLGSLPLCLDELCLKDTGGFKGDLESIVYQFCEGVGRSRGSRTGGTQRQRQWNCCAISTGETPLIKERSRAGAANRVLEIEFGERPLFADNVRTADTIRQNYGFAGKAFISALQRPGAVDEVSSYQREYYARMLDFPGVTDKQALVASLLLAADRFAAIHVFDDCYNLHPEDLAPMTKRTEDVDTNRRAYNWLMGTIAENNSRFEPTDEHYSGPIWGKLDEVGGKVTACIICSRFDELLSSAGYDPKSFRKYALRHGLLETQAGKTTKVVRLTSLSAVVRCVCVKMIDLDAEKEEPIPVEIAQEEMPF